MRVVYDDKMQNEFVGAVKTFVNGLNIKDVIREEWGMNRVQMGMVKEMLNNFLRKNFNMEIGKTVVHAHDIGNNCKYPVYYHGEGNDEIQQCAYINLNSGMFSEGYLSCEDYDGNRIGTVYELNQRGIKIAQ